MLFLDPLLLLFAKLAPFAKKATPAIIEAPALHPLVFLPFHLIGHHLTARLLPNRRVTYPLHFIFAMTQYCVEHFSAELPSVAAFGPLLVAITLGMAPYIYYRALKATEGPKALIWAAIAMFPVMLGVFKGMELGFPKDTPEEQAEANLDRMHSLWHFVLHVAVLVNQLMVAYGVPWTPKAERSALVPPSPAHTTRAAVRQFKTPTEEPCSPQKRGVSRWAAKATKAA